MSNFSKSPNRVRSCRKCVIQYIGNVSLCERCREKKKESFKRRHVARNNDISYKYKIMIRTAKQSSKHKSINFNISEEWLATQIKLQNNKCLITGKTFEYIPNCPWQPSIDRIDISKGYTQDNCRIVCVCVNLSLNKWGDAVFFEMCRLAAYNAGGKVKYE